MTAHPIRMNTTSKIVIMSFNQDLAPEGIVVFGPRTNHPIVELIMQIVTTSAADEANTDLDMMD